MGDPETTSTPPESAGEPPSSVPYEEPEPGLPKGWPKHLALFLATLLSVFLIGALNVVPLPEEIDELGLLLHAVKNIHHGWSFAVPLMAILVTHEFGHYFAARWHAVPASLPYFIPLPLPPFGTMGAVIAMRGRIRSRNALLDIGAAGPLAGMVVAIPVLVVGLLQSEVKPLVGAGMLEGQCLLYLGLKQLVVGTIPPGHDVFLTATAFAGWAGLLVTMLNLIPIGQLDGGHIAYALFGERQNRLALLLHGLLVAVFAYNLVAYNQVGPGLVWLVWFVLLLLLRRASGVNHPPTEPGQLSPSRRWVAIGCLVLFVVLFMPTPMREQLAWLEPALPSVELFL
ncbi:MAG: site-2 protease family protein [Deltaproteobacteria bacterium]|nr:site-2 protease family protein [Deltaproteobacteria bacterium]